jgi:protein gp37
MGATTGIEWTDSTWNPIAGCRRVSPGCQNCYAERFSWRFAGEGLPWEGLVRETNQGPRWTGKVVLRPASLAWPLKNTPRSCFVASLSDVFQDELDPEISQALWGVMAALPQWTFQALTKRPARARDVLSRTTRAAALAAAARLLEGPRDRARLQRADHAAASKSWPPANVWLGTSVEDQERADQRLPDLVSAPAALRFVSVEPLLGPVSLSRWLAPRRDVTAALGAPHGVRWVIVGGESGPGARPMHPEWARAVRDQCRQVGTAFFFKQWGAWSPSGFEVPGSRLVECRHHGSALMAPWNPELVGRLLDGVLWSEKP